MSKSKGEGVAEDEGATGEMNREYGYLRMWRLLKNTNRSIYHPPFSLRKDCRSHCRKHIFEVIGMKQAMRPTARRRRQNSAQDTHIKNIITINA